MTTLPPVIHLIDTTGPGGAETVFLDLAQGMARRGWPAIPVIAGPGWVWDTAVARGLEPVALAPGGRFALGYLTRLARLASRSGARLIHAHLLGSAVYGGLAGRLAGVPVIATFHGMTDFPVRDPLQRLRYGLLRFGVDRITLVSDPLRTEVLTRTGYPADRAHVVHNGIDVTRFYPGRDPGLRHDLSLPPDAFVIGALGNVRPAKAYEVLVRAAALLPEGPKPWRVVIAGDTGDSTYPHLLQLVADLGLAGRVVFAGFRDDVAATLRGYDLFVLSSRSEGFSLATVQALATGLPVVATRSGGPEEILAGSEAGILVPPDDPAALAEAIVRVMQDSTLASALAARGPARARERFSLEAALDQYQELYRAL